MAFAAVAALLCAGDVSDEEDEACSSDLMLVVVDEMKSGFNPSSPGSSSNPPELYSPGFPEILVVIRRPTALPACTSALVPWRPALLYFRRETCYVLDKTSRS